MSISYDKVVKSNATNAKYENGYIIKNNHVELHIFNKEVSVIVVFDKEDYSNLSKYFWCFKYIGRTGHQQICIYTYLMRCQVNLGRFLLDVNDSNVRVEHKNRNCLDFQRNNLYIVHKNQYKHKIPQKTENFGICHVKRKNGHIVGYRVQYISNNGKKKVKYFGIKKYGTLATAEEKAIEFREQIINIKENVDIIN